VLKYFKGISVPEHGMGQNPYTSLILSLWSFTAGRTWQYSSEYTFSVSGASGKLLSCRRSQSLGRTAGALAQSSALHHALSPSCVWLEGRWEGGWTRHSTHAVSLGPPSRAMLGDDCRQHSSTFTRYNFSWGLRIGSYVSLI